MYRKEFLLLFSLVSLVVFCQNNLIGTWEYQSMYGTTQITFNTDKTIIVDGESANYEIVGDNIVVSNIYGSVNYSYLFNNGLLSLTFPDGTLIQMVKKKDNSNSESIITNNNSNTSTTNNNAKNIGKLLGTWNFQSNQGNVILKIISKSQLSYNGEILNYQLTEDALNVNTEYGVTRYPYAFSGDKLNVSFPEGYQISFSRSTNSNTQKSQNAQPNSQQGTVGKLYGKLCHYSGSSNQYSSYSRTEYVYFDGKGNFQYWKEASFSSESGQMYSGNNNPDFTGTYSVNGSQVTMNFQDGESITLKVNMVQNNGRITELFYGEKLYATGLCE